VTESVYSIGARRAQLTKLRSRVQRANTDPALPNYVVELINDLALELRRAIVALEIRVTK
jgi:hypothetical protein